MSNLALNYKVNIITTLTVGTRATCDPRMWLVKEVIPIWCLSTLCLRSQLSHKHKPLYRYGRISQNTEDNLQKC